MAQMTQEERAAEQQHRARANAILAADPLAAPADLARAVGCHPARAARYIREFQAQAGRGEAAPPSAPPDQPREPVASSGASALALMEEAQSLGAEAVLEGARDLLRRVRGKSASEADLQRAAIVTGILSDKVRDLRKMDTRSSIWADILSSEVPELLDDMIEEQAAFIAQLRARTIPLD